MKNKIILLLGIMMLATGCGRNTANNENVSMTEATDDVATSSDVTDNDTDAQDTETSTGMEASEEVSSVEADTPESTTSSLYVEDNILYTPDGRSGELLSVGGRNLARNISAADESAIAPYRVSGLSDKFKQIDFETEYDGTTYYFKCDLEKDGSKITYTNIDTNMETWEVSTGFCYGVPGRVVELGVMGTDSSIIIGNLSQVYIDAYGNVNEDTTPATLNGISLDYKNYLTPMRDAIDHDSIWMAELYDGEEQAKITDLWLDADDKNFGVSMEYMESYEFLNWRGVDPGNIQIGYIAQMYGLG